MRTHGRVVRRQAKGGREHAGERSERARRNEQDELQFEPSRREPLGNKKDLSNKTKAFTKTGALGGVRTHNLLIRSQMLYPIELRVHSTKFDKFNITK